MMKQIFFTGAMLLTSALAGEALATCDGILQQNLTTLLSGNTVCDATATYDTSKPEHPTSGIKVMGIQEEHHGDGQLWDFKCGTTGNPSGCPNPDTDRRSQVGTWSVANDVSANATVSYNYPALSGPYSVYFNGTNYEFCTAPNAAPVATVTIVATGGDPNVRVCP